MNDLPVVKRNYQAEVYLALATVIQAITLTALGNEVVVTLKNPQASISIWIVVTAILSLQLCISFWYLFVRDYFFGFRMINLTAMNHMVIASFIFILGFLQFIAFQFLAEPRLWLTLVLMGIGMVLLNAWYTSGNIAIVNVEGAHEVMQLDRGSNLFFTFVLVAVGCLILWYSVPSIDTVYFRVITFGVAFAALFQLNASAIRAFQKHLEAGL
jgi:hypothetical protein